MKFSFVFFFVISLALINLTACSTSTMTDSTSDKFPSTPAQFADEAGHFVGKKILAAITYQNSNGDALRLKQFHGTVISVGEDGLVIQLEGDKRGDTFTLPPDIRGIREAEPAIYTLKETGEKVEDPDFLAEFTVISDQ